MGQPLKALGFVYFGRANASPTQLLGLSQFRAEPRDTSLHSLPRLLTDAGRRAIDRFGGVRAGACAVPSPPSPSCR